MSSWNQQTAKANIICHLIKRTTRPKRKFALIFSKGSQLSTAEVMVPVDTIHLRQPTSWCIILGLTAHPKSSVLRWVAPCDNKSRPTSPSTVAGFVIDPAWTPITEGGAPATDFDSWPQSLLRDKRWICHTTLKAAATRLGCHITVLLDSDTGCTPIQLQCANTAAKVLVLYLKDQRYQAVIPNPARSWPLEWTADVDTLSQIPRAGVASKSSSKRDTPRIDKSSMDTSAWFPPSTPSKSPNPFPAHTPRATSSSSKKQHLFETPARSSSTSSRSSTPRHPHARGTPCPLPLVVWGPMSVRPLVSPRVAWRAPLRAPTKAARRHPTAAKHPAAKRPHTGPAS